MTTTAPAPSFTDLAAKLRGRVITATDADYDDLRRVFAGDVDSRPAAIARVADAGDVAAVIAFARESDIDLAIRSGGHSNAGQSASEGGLVLDVRDLTSIDLDVGGRTVWAGAGLTAMDLTNATTAHGLAVGFGDTGSVGISGLTLGGGIGYLVRKHGLTIDSLLAAEIVTADGETRLVDATHEPDLFWGIRGGGGNFGVATRFKYDLADVSSVTGGMLVLPATPEVITGSVAAAKAAPEELSAIINVMPAPPMTFLAEEHHGTLIVFAFIVHSGDAAAGAGAMEPFRTLATPLADLLGPMPYASIYQPVDDTYRPKAVERSFFIDDVDLDAARRIVADLGASDAELRAVQLRVLGGAMARVPAEATAFAYRTRPMLALVVSFHNGTREDRARRLAWVDTLAGALGDYETSAYVNFLMEEGTSRVRAAYPGETWKRLVELKRRYDPGNLFRGNQNIPPR